MKKLIILNFIKSLKKFVLLKPNAKSFISLHIVCGGRRSGTTLLNAILCSSPLANELGQESQILTKLVEVYKWGLDNFQLFGSSFFKNKDSMYEYFKNSLFDFVNRIANYASPNGALILKNPELSLVITEITEIFPEAKLYAIIRDPRDQICSEFEVANRRRNNGIKNYVFENRDVEYLSKNYLNYISNINKLKRTYPKRILILKYEDLILKPSETLSELEDFSGLKLNFNPNKKWNKVSEKVSLHEGYSQSKLYGEPLSNSSLYRYKSELTSYEISLIEETCAEIMSEFGYK
jgi:hypothetical protein